MDFNNCAKRYVSRTDESGRMLKNIANFGLDVGSRAKLTRNGEYYGVEIEAVEYIHRLFTTDTINKIYQSFVSGNTSIAINIASIQTLYVKYGDDIIHHLITMWCKYAHVPLPKEIASMFLAGEDIEELNKRIQLDVSSGIVGKIKITGIGPILPSDWIGKIFNGAEELHNAMDTLPARLGKPHVTYCCTYGMMIQSKSDTLIDLNTIDNFFLIESTQFGIKSQIINKFSENDKYLQVTTNIKKYMQVSSKKFITFRALILVDKNVVEKNTNQNNLGTSYLCSLLQKCFRNYYTMDLLNQTISNLNYSKGYNLPDQHYAKVSGPKQMCWRSYISIIEDVNAYFCDHKYLDLLDLLLLSLVFNEEPNLQMTKCVLKQFQSTMQLVINIKNISGWKNFDQLDLSTKSLIESNHKKNRILNSIVIANQCVNMMQGDRLMLAKFYNYVQTCDNLISDINNVDKFYFDQQDPTINLDTRVIAYDMHCYPNILIELQGSLKSIKKHLTLQMLSSFIWNNSSSYNTRFNRKLIDYDQHVAKTLVDIQYHHIMHNKKIYKQIENICEYSWICDKFEYQYINTNDEPIPENIKRNSFLLVFGRTYRLDKKIGAKVHNIILCGNTKEISKVKLSSGKSSTIYIEGNQRYLAEKEFITQFGKDSDYIDFKKLAPPIGWKWKENLKSKQKLMLKLIKSDDKKMTNHIEFYVGNYKLNAFDGSPLLEPILPFESVNTIQEHFEDTLNVALYNDNTNGNIYESLIELHTISKIRFEKNDHRIFETLQMFKLEKQILLYVRARILMAIENTVIIGPCDRGGNKTSNSISYQYEGIIWRIMIVLSALYPHALKTNTMFNYILDRSTYEYVHMMNLLNSLIENANNSNVLTKNIGLKTTLWEHQQKSVNTIVNGFYVKKSRGFGDASGVGTGKTLVALSVMIVLYNKSKQDQLLIPNSGFLVMLPSEILYETWREEIKKHTHGLEIVEQHANGKLTGKITSNTIVITTMGRCRNHPILHQWLLVVIDECLTVQNKEALQTEEAWRQSSYSYFGVLLLSATFFRARFDKMTHMLNMLNTVLPKTSEYLDTILSESIVCNLNENERKWTTHINYFELTSTQAKQYEKILSKKNSDGAEKVYAELEKFIMTNVDYIKLFEKSIDTITQSIPNARILIYAESKAESDAIANTINNVERFTIPLTKSEKSHIVVSYSEGTFGLNNLTDYNVILTRVPEPDKLPQMKGRLDRPQQLATELHLEYIIIKNTIEEAGLVRLEICKNFYGNYIMPLADFFNLALKN